MYNMYVYIYIHAFQQKTYYIFPHTYIMTHTLWHIYKPSPINLGEHSFVVEKKYTYICIVILSFTYHIYIHILYIFYTYIHVIYIYIYVHMYIYIYMYICIYIYIVYISFIYTLYLHNTVQVYLQSHHLPRVLVHWKMVNMA